jgi:hypothetical protein
MDVSPLAITEFDSLCHHRWSVTTNNGYWSMWNFTIITSGKKNNGYSQCQYVTLVTIGDNGSPITMIIITMDNNGSPLSSNELSITTYMHQHCRQKIIGANGDNHDSSKLFYKKFGIEVVYNGHILFSLFTSLLHLHYLLYLLILHNITFPH